jgi:hypothetical protein
LLQWMELGIGCRLRSRRNFWKRLENFYRN